MPSSFCCPLQVFRQGVQTLKEVEITGGILPIFHMEKMHVIIYFHLCTHNGTLAV